MLHHRTSYYRQRKGILIGLAILTLLILTTGRAYALSETQETQSCVFATSSGSMSVLVLLDIGSEIDARLMSELESSKCSVEELASKISSGELTGSSLDLVLASSQGLAHDLRLMQELTGALEVVKELSVPGRFGYYNIWW